jgi:hypothetical protein
MDMTFPMRYSPVQGRARSLGAGALGITGGAMIVVGAMLPWLSLFAGLRSFPGTTGLYGRLLLAGGIMAAVAGAALLWTGWPVLRRALGGFGLTLLAFAGWLTVGLFETLHGMQTNPMLVAKLGPGLFVVLAGALLVASTLLFRDRGEAGLQGRDASR